MTPPFRSWPRAKLTPGDVGFMCATIVRSAALRRRRRGSTTRATERASVPRCIVFDGWFRKRTFEGCSFINVLLESDADSPVRHAAAVHLSKIRAIVRALANDANLREPEKFAQAWHMLMKGSIVSACEGNRNAAREVCQSSSFPSSDRGPRFSSRRRENREFATVLSKKRYSRVENPNRFRQLHRNSLFSMEQGIGQSKTGNEYEIYSDFRLSEPDQVVGGHRFSRCGVALAAFGSCFEFTLPVRPSTPSGTYSFTRQKTESTFARLFRAYSSGASLSFS